jgi:hypothetical protein
MRRHVRQGLPDWEDVMVDGCLGRLAAWTDGVANGVTIFVVHDGFGLEIEASYMPHVAEFITEVEMRAIVGSARWLA